MNKLYIDTTSNAEVIIRLSVEKKTYEVRKEIANNRTQVVLPLIHTLLKQHTIKLHDLTNIEVNAGPGSFTGVRVGVSIANALAFGLGIPVNEIKLVEPIY